MNEKRAHTDRREISLSSALLSLALAAELSGGVDRGKGASSRKPADLSDAIPAGGDNDRPYAPPYLWAAFVVVGGPN
jgi:hypothetical protein